MASAVAITLAAYIIAPFGVGISEDSVSYLAAAKSLSEQGKILMLGGSPSARWGPLYPVQLALFSKLPFSLNLTVAVYNILLFVFTIGIAWKLIRASIGTKFIRLVALASIVTSFAMVQVFSSMWSEPLLIFLITLFIFLFLEYSKKDNIRILIAMSFVCGLAVLQRYPGIFLLPVAAGFLLRQSRNPQALMRSIIMLTVATLPLLIWLGRNFMLTGTLTGARDPGGYLFWKNMMVLTDTLSSWALPMQIPLAARLLVAFPAFFLLIMLAVRLNNLANWLHLAIICAYTVVLVSSYITDIEEPRDRLLSPVFISFTILLFSGVERIVLLIEKRKMSLFLIKAAILLWMIYPVARIAKNAHQWHHYGMNIYNSPLWQSSETMRWVGANDLDSKSFSNDIFAIYYFTGKLSGFVPKTLYEKRFDRFYNSVQSGNYLIWFENKNWYRWHELDQIEKNLELTEEMKFSDGTIYKITGRKIKPSSTND